MSHTPHRITQGDIRTALGAILTQGGKPIDLTSKTVKFRMVAKGGATIIAETETGITKHPTQAFTVDAANKLLLANEHRVIDGREIVVAADDALPTPLAAGTRYFANQCSPNAFGLSAFPYSELLAVTGGSGNHTFAQVGSVQFAFQDAHVANVGEYYGWFSVYDGDNSDHFPVDGRSLRILIVAAG